MGLGRGGEWGEGEVVGSLWEERDSKRECGVGLEGVGIMGYIV